MFIPILLLILGFLLLILGADWLIKGASSLAKRLNVPELVIGLTIVAFGTSAPELIVNIMASIKGASDITYGNIIGSNNFNILIILGISSLIYPLDVKKSTVWKEIPFALFISIIALFLVNDRWFNSNAVDVLSRLDSIIMLSFFVLFLIYSWYLSKQGLIETNQIKSYSLVYTVCFIVAGLAGLIFGGEVVVKQAIIIAREFGISEKIIGLTIVAAGTSLPELATSAVAAWKKHPDIAIGNIVGSNIFNLLLILGISALIHPPLYKTSFNVDFYLMILATFLLFLFMFTLRKHRLDRWEGALFILVYIAYAVFLLK
jgi:cation:H+ antiporter